MKRRWHGGSNYRGVGWVGTRVAWKDVGLANIFLWTGRWRSVGGTLVVMMGVLVHIFVICHCEEKMKLASLYHEILV